MTAASPVVGWTTASAVDPWGAPALAADEVLHGDANVDAVMAAPTPPAARRPLVRNEDDGPLIAAVSYWWRYL